MVLSKIDSSVSYPELKRANPEDADMEADIYALQIKNVEVVIALGNSRDDFRKNNIIYFPIYLVKSNKKVVQIGIFEVENSKLPSYIDQDGELDLEKADDPLIYNFATKAFLEKKRLIPPKDETENTSNKENEDDEIDLNEKKDGTYLNSSTEKKALKTDEMSIPEQRADIFIMTKGIEVPPLLDEESKQDAKDIREKYKEKPWCWDCIYDNDTFYNNFNLSDIFLFTFCQVFFKRFFLQFAIFF